jgi:polar amino acid transport system substrate-binding protein
MTGWLAFRRIILPQSIRTILPPMTGDFVALFKDTSIVSTIAVIELTKQYQILSKSSMKYLEIGLLTAALYLAMSVPLGIVSRRLERRWGGAPCERRPPESPGPPQAHRAGVPIEVDGLCKTFTIIPSSIG